MEGQEATFKPKKLDSAWNYFPIGCIKKTALVLLRNHIVNLQSMHLILHVGEEVERPIT